MDSSSIAAQLTAIELSLISALNSEGEEGVTALLEQFQSFADKIEGNAAHLSESTLTSITATSIRIKIITEGFTASAALAEQFSRTTIQSVRSHLSQPQPIAPTRNRSYAPYREFFLANLAHPYPNAINQARLNSNYATPNHLFNWFSNARRRSTWLSVFQKFGGGTTVGMRSLLERYDDNSVNQAERIAVEAIVKYFEEGGRDRLAPWIADILGKVGEEKIDWRQGVEDDEQKMKKIVIPKEEDVSSGNPDYGPGQSTRKPRRIIVKKKSVSNEAKREPAEPTRRTTSIRVERKRDMYVEYEDEDEDYYQSIVEDVIPSSKASASSKDGRLSPQVRVEPMSDEPTASSRSVATTFVRSASKPSTSTVETSSPETPPVAPAHRTNSIRSSGTIYKPPAPFKRSNLPSLALPPPQPIVPHDFKPDQPRTDYHSSSSRSRQITDRSK
jgi:hypothetical protein